MHREAVTVRGEPRQLLDITKQVAAVVGRSGIADGLCHVFIQHTSAGLVIQENADPAVLRDLARWLAALAPESPAYEHQDEGPDDMPAHLRSVVTRTSETLPVENRKLLLGTWQALYLFEHRAATRPRRLIVTITGQD